MCKLPKLVVKEFDGTVSTGKLFGINFTPRSILKETLVTLINVVI